MDEMAIVAQERGFEKLRFGILGVEEGNARAMAEALERSEYAELVAVAGGAVDDWCTREELNVQRYASYQDLVNDENVQAVYVGVSPSFRGPWCFEAARMKKHLLVEKPLGRTFDEAEKIVGACDEADVVLMDATAFVHHERSRMILAQLRDGRAFGSEATLCDVSISFPGRREFIDGLATVEADNPLGVVGDLGWYCAKWGAIAFPGKPLTVSAKVKPDEGPPLELRGTVDFEDGRTLHLHCSYLHAFDQRITVKGGPGSKVLTCDDILFPKVGPTAFQLHTYAEKPLIDLDTAVVAATQTHSADPNGPDQNLAMINTFTDVVRGHARDASSSTSSLSSQRRRQVWARNALLTQSIVNALLASARDDGNLWNVETQTAVVVSQTAVVGSQKQQQQQQQQQQREKPPPKALPPPPPPPPPVVEKKTTTTTSKKKGTTRKSPPEASPEPRKLRKRPQVIEVDDKTKKRQGRR